MSKPKIQIVVISVSADERLDYHKFADIESARKFVKTLIEKGARCADVYEYLESWRPQAIRVASTDEDVKSAPAVNN